MAQKEATLLLKIKTMGQEALESLNESFDAIKTGALAAFAAISAIVVKSIHDYREQEVATNALTQAMVNNGIYSKALKDDYLAQAAAIQKLTLYGDEQVIAAQAALQMQLGEKKVTQDLTMAVADLATAKKIDLVSAAEMVGKTIGGTNNMLMRQGIHFDNNLSGAQRYTAVLHALNDATKGQATAATTGLGAMIQLKNAVSDLFEVFGEKLAPFIVMASNALKAFAEDTQSVTPIMDAFISSLQFVSLYVLSALEAVKELGIVIGVGLSTAVSAASKALEGEFSQALDIVKMGNQQIADEIKKSQAETEAAQVAIFAAKEQAERDHLAREEADLKQSLANKAEAKRVMSEEEFAKLMENNQIKYDMQAAANELERAQHGGQKEAILAAQIAQQDAILKSHESHAIKLAAQKEKFRLTEKQRQDAADKAEIATKQQVFGVIAGLTQSNNSVLAAIGKAAALTQIAIATPEAVAKAYTLGPIAGPIAAGLTYAAMGAQAAKVAGIPLAEGGIVKARPGGIQATIGEGGKDEAVIPLENGQIPGSGQGVVIHFNGPVMGDERQAQEFAAMVDKELLKLRQNGGSVAFDRIT